MLQFRFSSIFFFQKKKIFLLKIKLTHSSLTIFTFTSTNQERWFQLSVRDGHLVGQIVNAGLINEIISDVRVDDNR